MNLSPRVDRAAAWRATSLACAVAGVTASSALLVDYLRPHPLFCAVGGGCDAVRQTALATPLGIPLPAAGVVGFFALGVVAVRTGPRAPVAQLVLSALAAVAGAFFLSAQAWLRAFCPFCCVADACGIASALAAVGRMSMGPGGVAGRQAGALQGSGSPVLPRLAAVLLPLGAAAPVVAGLRAGPAPRVIRDEIARTPPGQTAIVDFVDFECPFCRQTHAALEPLIEARRARIHHVRLNVPLRTHPHALDAARAACCGTRLGRGEAMAEALFAAPEDELTPEGCERIAQRLGLSRDAFRGCLDDPETRAQIERERAMFKEAGGRALPTLWIGERELVGQQSADALARAIDEALARAGS